MSVPSGTYSQLDEDQWTAILNHPLLNEPFREDARIAIENINRKKKGLPPLPSWTTSEAPRSPVTDQTIAEVLTEMQKNFPYGLTVQQEDDIKMNMRKYLQYLKFHKITLSNRDKQNLIKAPILPQYRNDVRLRNMEEEEDLRRRLKFEKTKITNMSFNELAANVSATFLDTLDDLFNKPANVGAVQHIIDTFTKEGRLAYYGIFLIVLSLFIGIFM